MKRPQKNNWQKKSHRHSNSARPGGKDEIRRTGLVRALSKLGYCSRSRAAALIRDGRVYLNGKIQLNPEHPVRLGSDRIAVDDSILRAQAKVHLMLNKPRGVVTTASDEKGRETVYAFLPDALPWVAPVGRLDKASEGLLLLTNDSGWAARVAAPETHLEKTYHVQIDAVANEKLLHKLTDGVRVETGEVMQAKRVEILRVGERNSWLIIVLDEGKNRQIRRMLEALGVRVLRLVRVAIGRLALGDLPKGACRALTAAEKAALDDTMSRGAAGSPKDHKQASTKFAKPKSRSSPPFPQKQRDRVRDDTSR